jgi:hypothetical protein
MILSWDKPAKAMSHEEWEAISADSAPPGVYTPNMSKEDMLKWKAKKIGQRVEIRKTAGAQILIRVTLEDVTISMNGTAKLSLREALDMSLAIAEATQVLKEAKLKKLKTSSRLRSKSVSLSSASVAATAGWRRSHRTALAETMISAKLALTSTHCSTRSVSDPLHAATRMSSGFPAKLGGHPDPARQDRDGTPPRRHLSRRFHGRAQHHGRRQGAGGDERHGELPTSASCSTPSTRC